MITTRCTSWTVCVCVCVCVCARARARILHRLTQGWNSENTSSLFRVPSTQAELLNFKIAEILPNFTRVLKSIIWCENLRLILLTLKVVFLFFLFLNQKKNYSRYRLDFIENKSIDFHQTQLHFVLFRETTCSGLRGHHQAIFTKIVEITCIAVRMKPNCFICSYLLLIFRVFVMVSCWWSLRAKQVFTFLK